MQEEATDAVGEYSVALKAHYEEGMAAKLGLPTYNRDIAVGLLTNMYQDDADFTNTFRALSDISVDDPEDSMPTSLSKVCPAQMAHTHLSVFPVAYNETFQTSLETCSFDNHMQGGRFKHACLNFNDVLEGIQSPSL